MSTIDDKAAALLERPSLDALSFLLRHKEYWPVPFSWDYTHCEQCAMGMAWRLWDQVSDPNEDSVAEVLDITSTEAGDIFLGCGDDLNISMRAVTPEHVADAIDALLASRAP